ncbi:MAG: hypothetical protein AB1298_00540 [Bacteroidota bacterium]
MKHLVLSIFLLVSSLTAQNSLQGQITSTDSTRTNTQLSKGSWEISFIGGFARNTYESTYSYSYPSPYESTSKSSSSVIDLAGTVGFFIVNGFSIEPEFRYTLIIPENGANGKMYSLIGNLSYSYLIPKKSYAVFARIGYGVSNGVPIAPPNTFILTVLEEKTNTILNAGIGIKFLLSEMVALRSELGYTSFSYSKETKNYGVTGYKRNYSSLKVLFGFSIFF